ncbi:apolipoprotein D-like [Periophthalmus magnuspinnatus]|uniref:apolipoprotein D-like n=1 Tax=Periophthalmus magnuspinnatus TaxID=409849 RepID=UPI00145B4259|nr:apolipoprotein D-like [Periophthalmus magnuspinnatus]
MWVYLLLLMAPLVSAQTFSCGPCPDVTVQKTFDLQRYLGRWFEITKLPASFERGKCIEANYALRPDGTIQVLNKQMEEPGKLTPIEGTAVVKNQSEPAKLGVGFSYLSPVGTYWVLYTDYTSVAVVYSCTDIMRVFKVEFAWILARNRTLSMETRARAEAELQRAGVKLCQLIPTDQTGCDLNTLR